MLPWTAGFRRGMKISFVIWAILVDFSRKGLTFQKDACMITAVTICNPFVSTCYHSDTDRIQVDVYFKNRREFPPWMKFFIFPSRRRAANR